MIGAFLPEAIEEFKDGMENIQLSMVGGRDN
jgi:hypothetical protein